MDKVKIALFSGGRGTSNFTRALLSHPQISLTLLINGYDDGLSTGRIRQFVPGILGPSDFRKNFSYLFDESQNHRLNLKNLFEYRLSSKEENASLRSELVNLIQEKEISDRNIDDMVLQISVQDARWLKKLIKTFLDYEAAAKQEFDYRDCSIGNIIMAAQFLQDGRNFNRSLDNLSQFIKPKAQVLNITQGENYILCALKVDGGLLSDEAQIVSPGSAPIEEIFLLQNYLSDQEKAELNALPSLLAKKDFMRARSCFPEISQAARQALAEADIIIYGPGTQHSSLFPSYLTVGCTEAIQANKEAYKIFIGNINADHDIKGDSASSLMSKFKFYSRRKNQLDEDLSGTLTHVFIHSEFSDEGALQNELEPQGISIKKTDWEKKDGQHALSLISDELISLAQIKKANKLMNQHHLISIVVPVLNEEKTVSKVLDDLEKLNLFEMHLEKEIIVVDGGSTDKSIELIKKHKEVKFIGMEAGAGRGQAYVQGIKMAKGNIVVFFPSDSEYDAKDIKKILQPFLTEQAKCVLGTRATKSINMSKTILNIYEGNRFSYFASKYGGILLSILMLYRHNRYITDCLTSVKAFHRKTIQDWNFKSKGFDFDIELVIKMIENNEYIYEVPVNFIPRKKSEGKKITVLDGFASILRIFKKS